MICVVLLQQRRLDRDALAALIRQTSGFNVVAALTSDWETVAVCKLKRPDAVILDISLPDEGAISLAKCLLHNGYTKRAILLGNETSDVWEQKATQIAGAEYLARNVSSIELLDSIARHCTPSPSENGDTTKVMERFSRRETAHRTGGQGLASLSAREIQVLKLIAEGNTIRQCAEKLSLAVSTLDNHKTRVMKKLNVHRSVDLVRLAIREGVIEP